MEVSRKDDFESAFKGAIKARSGAVAVNLSALINSNQQSIAELAVKYRLPAIYPRREIRRQRRFDVLRRRPGQNLSNASR